MKPLICDVVVLGSGFGGSLTALILTRLGLQVAVVDKSRHPRFAIGESSTPIADRVLMELAQRYDLDALIPLCRYGTARQQIPHVNVGLKRGFSYFAHQPDQPFKTTKDHRSELLVAATRDDFHADTHWLRSDVDAFFAQQLQAMGIQLLENTRVERIEHEPCWRIHCAQAGGRLTLECKFVIDATGAGGLLLNWLNIRRSADPLFTTSCALYGHFRDVVPWQTVLEQAHIVTSDHPFLCDAAAVHHILEQGWMWQLRFDNDVTSVGFALRGDCADPTLSAQDQWNQLVAQYPSLHSQLSRASLIAPEAGLVRTGRLQYLADNSAGADWACLPNTAGVIDPLHSTGIAHTLCGIERLAATLEHHWDQPSLADQLASDARQLRQELLLVDKLVYGCYLAMDDFRLFTSFCMLYFAAATTYERRRDAGDQALSQAGFLCAGDALFSQTVDRVLAELRGLVATQTRTPQAIERFERQVAQEISPFNTAGLCDPSVYNMYHRTVAPPKSQL